MKKNTDINIKWIDHVVFAEAENDSSWMSSPTNALVGPGRTRERSYGRERETGK